MATEPIVDALRFSEVHLARALGYEWEIWADEDSVCRATTITVDDRNFGPAPEKLLRLLATDILHLHDRDTPRREAVSRSVEGVRTLLRRFGYPRWRESEPQVSVRAARKKLRGALRGAIPEILAQPPWSGLGRAYDERASWLEKTRAEVWLPER